MNSALIGLGSNLGERQLYLHRAVSLLAQHPCCELLAQSGIYQSKPMGPSHQPDYLNMACHIATQLEPAALLDLCKAIETQLGRVASERWGPRCIDLDILLFGDHQLQSKHLTLPHPGLAKRAFVLLPLNDLVPDRQVAGTGQSVRQLLEKVEIEGVSLVQPGTPT